MNTTDVLSLSRSCKKMYMYIIKTVNQSIQYPLVYVKKRTSLTVECRRRLDVVKTEKGISLDKFYVESDSPLIVTTIVAFVVFCQSYLHFRVLSCWNKLSYILVLLEVKETFALSLRMTSVLNVG
jgi:hypothetical protein